MTFAAAVSLTVFAALILASSLQLLAASGHFPLCARGAGMKSAPAVLLSIAVNLAALMTGALAAWERLPWEGLVIAAGLAVLAAPLALQRFSDRFVDGRGALVAFPVTAAFCALLLLASGI